MGSYEKKVLCVGLSCLDIVMYCKSYPLEDSDQRCLSHKWQRGGNASNNSTIFAEFNIPCEILSTLSNDIGGKFMQQDFKKHNISIENCHLYEEYDSAFACIWINMQNASRTIVSQTQNIPGVTFEDFKQLDLNNYHWIHFECRPKYEDLKLMLKHVKEWNENEENHHITISLEIEKPKLELKEFIVFGDFVFISKDFAKACDNEDMISAVTSLSCNLGPSGVIICPWGEKGASAKSLSGPVHVANAIVPDKLVSTLGAGDTFIAATIIGLLKDMDISEAITIGCKVAGTKCGMYVSEGLSKSFPDLL
ncbi:hypothetical protein JTE90_012484 [Oedothorax gibbosus]|uniref:Carbohydrate kinase PfkB domain-containing protein n=1 Tax=Oedothorax gibbosus TaxID=931172 RepID=A0AAV6U4K4_9ARAC|nr:hypothetical protein JTE90_012484 [Oedothorax gibbosus]